MIREIEKIILENGPRWEIPFFPPRGLFFIKTSGSKKSPTAQSVIFLVFDQRSESPRWVVKVSRDSSTFSSLGKEYKNLLYFYHTLSPPIRKTLPRPLLSRESDQGFLFIEGGLRGKVPPAFIRLEGSNAHEKEIGAIFDKVEGWLMQFQQETREGEIEVNDAWIEQEARIPWQVYRSRYAWTEQEESFSEKSLKEWRHWSGTRIPRVGCHGDFWSGNFFLNGPTLSVFDWTFSKRGALPFDDLFLFISSLAVDFPAQNKGGDDTGSFEKIFFDPHWLRRKIQETLALFFSELKLPPPLLSQLFPLFLLKMAIRKEGEYQIHSRRNPVWRERLLFYIRNEERFIQIERPNPTNLSL